MKLYVDLESLQLIEGPGFRNPVSSIRFKRGDAARLEVAFLQNATTPITIGDPSTLELQLGIKPRGRYDVGYLVHESAWTLPVPGAETPTYVCSPSFNTVQLDSAMQVGSATGTELAEIVLMGEITWRSGAGDPTSTRTFLVMVENDVNRGTEGVPTDAEPPYPAPDRLVTIDNFAEHAAPEPPELVTTTLAAYSAGWARKDAENALLPGHIFEVHSEGGRVMHWLGDTSAGATADIALDLSGLHVVRPGQTMNPHFVRSGDKYFDGPVYRSVDDPDIVVVRLPANIEDFGLSSTGSPRWVLVILDANTVLATAPATGTIAPPWTEAWSNSATVLRNVFTAPANWSIERETYSMFVLSSGYYIVNGVFCTSGTLTHVGWMTEGGLPSVRNYSNGGPVSYDLDHFDRYSTTMPSSYYLQNGEPITHGETFFRTLKAPSSRLLIVQMN